MYKCENCGYIFEEFDYYHEKHGFLYPPFERISCCPSCKDTDYTICLQCDVCEEYFTGEYVEVTDGYKICSNCYSIKNTKE